MTTTISYFESSDNANAVKPSVAIVGAGVIGLGIGWRLAAAGCRVDVFDKGEAGTGASHAAAGMLAAGVEVEPGEEGQLPLNRHSQELWPGFAAELRAASGIDVELRTEGTLVVALNADDVARLRFNFDLQKSLGLDHAWLSGAEVKRREPYLHTGTVAAIHSPGDHQVDNRKVAAALKAAFGRAGGILHENTPIAEILTEGGRATGVLPEGGEPHRADVTVLAAGAWSRAIPGLPDGARPPVRPVKGQMAALRMDPHEPLLRHVVWTPGVYLVPRLDGRLVIGATVEERGFDTTLTAGGVMSLIEGAWRALPGIEELPIDELWVGFRPGSRDDAPILGPSALDGLVLATGHHRNGILLTPITANAVSDLILTGRIADVIRPFGIDRFAAKAAPSRPDSMADPRADPRREQT
ncbi:glycine oxidase [Skermanella stibiiresistens SB22]|uniref:Glycine oxidase n=1 Tax=Skermanella stibiiresistens SB22 TaxID=1385369 RepID=W9H503_9PROT|nr:glycine oxidase ThiO [Skermanella stibiiresistens]EWY41310.1 glycine oxidase [Skermanella stibiiresistens SB22]